MPTYAFKLTEISPTFFCSICNRLILINGWTASSSGGIITRRRMGEIPLLISLFCSKEPFQSIPFYANVKANVVSTSLLIISNYLLRRPRPDFANAGCQVANYNGRRYFTTDRQYSLPLAPLCHMLLGGGCRVPVKFIERSALSSNCSWMLNVDR